MVDILIDDEGKAYTVNGEALEIVNERYVTITFDNYNSPSDINNVNITFKNTENEVKNEVKITSLPTSINIPYSDDNKNCNIYTSHVIRYNNNIVGRRSSKVYVQTDPNGGGYWATIFYTDYDFAPNENKTFYVSNS